MPLKRKRSSTSALSPSTSTSTTNTTSRSTSPNPLPDIQMSNTSAPQYPPVDPSSYTPSSHLDSRTRKRFRDNRPDEDVIHGLLPPHSFFSRSNRRDHLQLTQTANTYATLFAAASSLPLNHPPAILAAPPTNTAIMAPSTTPRPAPPPRREASLHDYWTINTPPLPPPTASSSNNGLGLLDHDGMHIPTTTTTLNNNNNYSCCRCEDCDNALVLLLPPSSGTVADAGMMDVDGGDLGGEFACRSCGKRVCDTCAVVQIGVGRDCLGCKTSRREKWVGGIGWCP